MTTVSNAAEKCCIAELMRPEREHAGRVWVQGIVVEVDTHAGAQGVVVVSVDDGSAGAGCMSVRVKDAVNPPPLKKGTCTGRMLESENEHWCHCVTCERVPKIFLSCACTHIYVCACMGH